MIIEKLRQYKYPILVLFLGLLLLLLPSGEPEATPMTESDALGLLLSHTEGVGEARVICSECGVVICCEGAADAGVRLNVIRAVRSYTGFGSDKITILKMKN